MNILIIGGRGNISWHCSEYLASNGYSIFTLNRNMTIKTRRKIVNSKIKQITADVTDIVNVKKILEKYQFDVAIDFLCYTPQQAINDIELFENRVKHFIYISSAANYDRRHLRGSITENTPLYNPNWEYSNNKIICEKIFMDAYKNKGFPVTIVRPGHTYDTLIPEAVGNGCWTNASRLINKKPIVIHGDGTNLWTLTHSSDFAIAFSSLILNPVTYGQAYHITGEELYTWREIMTLVSKALGNNNPDFVYIPSEDILKENYELGIGIVGHKMWCDIYDNTKIKDISNNWRPKVSVEDGINETIKWLSEKTERQRINSSLDIVISKLCDKYR